MRDIVLRMSRASDLESYRTAAIAAVAAGDYATAISQAMAAKMTLATMPDSKQDANIETTWDRNAIDKFIAECKAQQASTTGLGSSVGVMQRQPVRYVEG